MDPRRRILVTTVVALAIALGVLSSVISTQHGSGRTALMTRAREFVTALSASGDDVRRADDLLAFLRPGDRSNPRVVASLAQLRVGFGETNDDLPVSEVRLLGEGRGVSYTAFASREGPRGIDAVAGLREVPWRLGPEGVWYLDLPPL